MLFFPFGIYVETLLTAFMLCRPRLMILWIIFVSKFCALFISQMQSLSGIWKCKLSFLWLGTQMQWSRCINQFLGIRRSFRHSAGSLPIFQQPICPIPSGIWVPKIGDSNGRSFAMLRPDASLGVALCVEEKLLILKFHSNEELCPMRYKSYNSEEKSWTIPAASLVEFGVIRGGKFTHTHLSTHTHPWYYGYGW